MSIMATRKSELVSAPRLVRSDLGDGASEVLTLVKINGLDGYYVEVCAGPEAGDDFVGLYSLDGDALPSFDYTWERAELVPAWALEAVEHGWESGSNRVTRLGAEAPEPRWFTREDLAQYGEDAVAAGREGEPLSLAEELLSEAEKTTGCVRQDDDLQTIANAIVTARAAKGARS